MIKYNSDHSKAKVRLLIGAVSESVTKTNKPFCKLDLIDTDFSHISVNVWDSTAKSFPLHHVFEAQLKCNEQGLSTSLKEVKVSPIIDTDVLSKVIPRSPSALNWALQVSNCIKRCTPQEQDIVNKLASQLYPVYSQSTAAKSNHHNFKGGLALHTYEMLQMYSSIQEALPFSTDPFVVTVSILYHDWGKTQEYTVGDSIDYTPAITLQGHPFLSAEHVKQALSSFGIPSSTVQHIQHCILAHHGRLEWGSPVVPATQEAFLVHHLDMLSGHGTTYKQTPNGTKSFALQTTVYHHNQF